MKCGICKRYEGTMSGMKALCNLTNELKWCRDNACEFFAPRHVCSSVNFIRPRLITYKREVV